VKTPQKATTESVPIQKIAQAALNLLTLMTVYGYRRKQDAVMIRLHTLPEDKARRDNGA